MVSKLLTFIAGQLNPGIIESTHGLNQSSNQARRPEFYKYTRLPRDQLGQIKSKFWIAKFSESIVLKVTQINTKVSFPEWYNYSLKALLCPRLNYYKLE